MKYVIYLFICCASVLLACTGSTGTVTVSVENPSDFNRENEMVEVDLTTVKEKLSLQDEQTIIVLDATSKQVPYQLVTDGKLIFPATLLAKEKAEYRITTGTPEAFTPMTYGRFVPERKDDFAWENNRSAFRVYGPALEATGEISNGMDFWVKSTDSLVIDKWYKNDLAGVASYHEDHGEGLDFYKVGRTLGLGMTAPYVNDSLCLGNNFTEYKVLDNGPLRVAFELRYKPYNAQGIEINETRVISLDAYSYFNKVQQTFSADVPEINVATGIVVYTESPEATLTEPQKGIMAYETPADAVNGTMYTGVIYPGSFAEIKIDAGHLLGIAPYKTGEKYLYYTGGGWSKAGFNSFAEWTDFLKKESEKIKQPMKVSIQ